MSVTFHVQGEPVDLDDPSTHLNVANTRARELLAWLGFFEEADDPGLCGCIAAGELAARCRRRLWPVARNEDHGSETEISTGARGVAVVICGRPADYLPMRTQQLLALAERAGTAGIVTFG